MNMPILPLENPAVAPEGREKGLPVADRGVDMPPIALRDQAVPDTPASERPIFLEPREASRGDGANLRTRLPFDRVALLLQGGGALGAYQAGVYEALAETGLHPDWVVGISIGAINSAIIAGNVSRSSTVWL